MEETELEEVLESSIIEEKGVKQFDESVETLFSEYETKANEANDELNTFRTAITNVMNKHKIVTQSFSTKKFTLVYKKPICKFDTDAFVMNESVDIVNAVSSIEEQRTFDIDKFMKEQPEMYEKYCNVTQTVKVDETKLSTLLPDIYKKYYSETIVDTTGSLRITTKKGK